MNLDPGEGTSDGHVRRTCDHKQNLIHSEVTIKQEIEIKEEPNDNTQLIESNEFPTVGMRNPMRMEMERASDTDDQMKIRGDFDCMKKEIKSEEKGKEVKDSNGDGNDQSNADVRDDGHRNNPSTNSNSECKQHRSNEKVKAKGKNRILAKKRNLAKASKTRKVRTKPQKIHKCSQCKYTASYKSHITKHIRTHTGEKPFECEICAKSSAQKGTLNNHEKTHLPRLRFRCSKCRCRFKNEYTKTIHETKCKRRQYECHLCRYSTPYSTHLKQHMRIHHTGEKPFECSICSKTFTTKKDLVYHSRIYTKQLPFNCTICGQRFIDEHEKQSHEKRCNCRRFDCYICRYNSFEVGYLKIHMRSNHTGDKPFRCGICDKEYFQKYRLNRHLAVHTKQRPIPISCTKCLRRFKDEDGKMAHEIRCNRRPFQCYLCKMNQQHLRQLKFYVQKSHIQSKVPIRVGGSSLDLF